LLVTWEAVKIFAVGIRRGVKGITDLEIDTPKIQADDEVLLKIIRVGLDGTDRTIVRENLFDPPPGENVMTLGHEAIGRVEEVGSKVKSLRVGDHVAPTVRRGCGRCASCLHGQSDTCSTGLFTERGIHKLHGYFTEYAVDKEEYLVKVPDELLDFAVLTEPLSIGEKVISDIKLVQSRLPWSCEHPEHRYDLPGWAGCKSALVVGAGPLGFMITSLLKLDSVETYVAEVVGEDVHRVKLIKELGAHYIHVTANEREEVERVTGPLDVIVEASGAVQLAIDLILSLGRNGIYVLTGLPFGVVGVCADGAALLRQLTRFNQVILGVVNSNKSHFEAALRDMVRLREEYGVALSQVVTHRYPLPEYKAAFENTDPNQLKIVLEIGS
jgi:threonine dehydrogenase-like Zn-dependent dehydrogenase